MNVNPEMISRYADGQVSPEERAAVEAALRDDPQAAIEFDELESLGELFGHVEPESVSEECFSALYALDGAPSPAFERVAMEDAPRRRSAVAFWGNGAAAAAVLFLAVYGLIQLTAKTDVTLREFARLTLDSNGDVVRTERLDAVTVGPGDAIAAGPGQRVSYLDPLGARIVLMPETRVVVGHGAPGELLDLTSGTVLLQVFDSEEPRLVEAGGFKVRSQGANFGVRVSGEEVRGAGFAKARDPEVTVAVRSGSCEVGENGGREQVEAQWCLKLRRGRPVERVRIWESPLHAALLQGRGYEIVPGFFSSEGGVRAILSYEWDRVSASEHELAITATEIGAYAAWFVAEVELERPSALELVRTRPLRGGETAAQEALLRSPVVPAGRHVVAFPLESFDAADALVRDVEVPVQSSRLVRLRLRSENGESPLKIKASLWSARPPADASEVVR